MQPDEVRYEEDMKPLGLDFIRLGLNDVLYFPDKGEIYTPNTNQKVEVEGRSDGDWDENKHPRNEHGQFTSTGGSGLTGDAESGIIEHKEEIISELRSNGFTYEVHIPAQEIDVESLSFDSAHITQRRHFVTQEQANLYIKNAKMSYTKTVDGDVYENYISDDGAAYVNTGVGLI